MPGTGIYPRVVGSPGPTTKPRDMNGYQVRGGYAISKKTPLNNSIYEGGGLLRPANRGTRNDFKRLSSQGAKRRGRQGTSVQSVCLLAQLQGT